MRNRLIPRVLVGLLTAGSLGACTLPIGTSPELPAILSISPSPGVFHLTTPSQPDTVTFTVRNVGPGETGELATVTVINYLGLDNTDVDDLCYQQNLSFNETCQVVVKLGGVPPHGEPYEGNLTVQGEHANPRTVRFIFL